MTLKWRLGRGFMHPSGGHLGGGSFGKGLSLPLGFWEQVFSPCRWFLSTVCWNLQLLESMIQPLSLMRATLSFCGPWTFQSLPQCSYSPSETRGLPPASVKEWSHPAIGSPMVNPLVQWLGVLGWLWTGDPQDLLSVSFGVAPSQVFSASAYHGQLHFFKPFSSHSLSTRVKT